VSPGVMHVIVGAEAPEYAAALANGHDGRAR
jgi:hypothetical protein